MTRTETITFNIGGHCYMISRSLLDQFPQSMLTMSSSEKWMQESESEIFIERDGTTFRFILTYMRDGRVTLPASEPKENFIRELEYFGIGYEEEDIDDGKAKVESYAFHLTTTLLPSLKNIVDDIKTDIGENEALVKGHKLALFCIEEFFKQQHSNLLSHCAAPGIDITLLPHTDLEKELVQSCYIHGDMVTSTANDRLRCVGLQVQNLSSRYESCVTVTVIGGPDHTDPNPDPNPDPDQVVLSQNNQIQVVASDPASKLQIKRLGIEVQEGQISFGPGPIKPATE
jgi:hypothetical protein